jgi:hypothetical protein
VLCLIGVIGCPDGDFGPARSSWLADSIHARGKRNPAAAPAPVSQLPLTADERPAAGSCLSSDRAPLRLWRGGALVDIRRFRR